jgi:hypothetical protein
MRVAKRWNALLLAAVPGLGHLYLGRSVLGLVLFTLFGLAANGFFFTYTLDPSDIRTGVLAFCGFASAAIWLASFLHAARLAGRHQEPHVAERKEYHLKRGLTQYVAGSFETARDEFLTVLKLDPTDVDARFHLAMAYARAGEPRLAVKAFKRCRSDDVDGKWRWEVQRELDRLQPGG